MISFTLDAWTSPNCIAFLGITAHWISENWQLNEILIDFHKLRGAHSGENLAEAFVQCCNEFDVLSKVFNYLYCNMILLFLNFNLILINIHLGFSMYYR